MSLPTAKPDLGNASEGMCSFQTSQPPRRAVFFSPTSLYACKGATANERLGWAGLRSHRRQPARMRQGSLWQAFMRFGANQRERAAD